MANLYELNVTTRIELGKAASRRMRRVDDLVPGVIYGGEEQPTPITVPHNVAHHALEQESFYTHILTLNIDGKAKQQVILKAVQRHPGKPRITHLDFFRINANEKLTMNIPIHFLNADSAPGVIAGGIVNHHMSELEVRCLPANLPEYIECDLAKLKLDEIIHLTQIKLPKGVELVALAHGEDQAHDHAVVSIHIPAVYIEPEIETAEAEAAPEGEGEQAEKEGSEEAKPSEE